MRFVLEMALWLCHPLIELVARIGLFWHEARHLSDVPPARAADPQNNSDRE